MVKKKFSFVKNLIVLFVLMLSVWSAVNWYSNRYSEFSLIGQKIYQNECGSNSDNLIFWNAREMFPSLGIGHFIWYPRGKRGPYEESFPDLIRFIKEEGIDIPQWLDEMDPLEAPWPTREEFYDLENAPEIRQLKEFLLMTMDTQVKYMVRRAYRSLPRILSHVPFMERGIMYLKFFTVSFSPQGMYPLIDYVNFKGEGVKETERYNNYGWGLLQVLEEMKLVFPGKQALSEFARAADIVLTRRVENAPPERDEHRWLPGWKNRIKTYVAEETR